MSGNLRAVVASVATLAMPSVAAPWVVGTGAGAQAATPVVSVGTATVLETFARGDWVPALVPVTLDRPATVDVTVAYATADGTAHAAPPHRDYEPAAGTLTIPAGSLGAQIEVLVLGDRAPEPDEVATVTLSDPAGAALGEAGGAVVIRDRAGAGLAVSDARVVEPDDGSAALVAATVSLSERRPGDVSVAWSTAGLSGPPPGGAGAGADYLTRSGTALIPAGRLDARIQLWVRGDTEPEGPEGFRVVLDPASTTTPVADAQGGVSIVDDEPGPPTTERVSVASDGTQYDTRGRSIVEASVSADGRYVAFSAAARQLVSRDRNFGPEEVYVRDRATGVTTLASRASDGTQALGFSRAPEISADGRFVAFESDAANLVPGDTNGLIDVFVHDRAAGTTTRVSVDSGGAQASGTSGEASISADGRLVAFSSNARDLVPGDAAGTTDVFVHDVATGGTTLASAPLDGVPDGQSYNPALSGDGRFVAFTSTAPDQVVGDTNGVADVFRHDLAAGMTTRVSQAPDGSQLTLPSQVPAVSADGRVVAFDSYDEGLVPGDTNHSLDVFVHDTSSGTTVRVSQASDGTQGNNPSSQPMLSADGRFVAFVSLATNLVPDDANGFYDVYLHDIAGGATSRVSVATGGGPTDVGNSFPAALSADGRWAVFTSEAANLVPGGDTNALPDAFVRGPLY